MYPTVNQMRQRFFYCLYITRLQPSYFPPNSNDILQLLFMCHPLASAGTESSRVYTQWHPRLGTVREAGPLSAREASKAGQSGSMSWRLFYHVGIIKHTSFLPFQIKHRRPQFNLIFYSQLQPGDLKLRFPFHTLMHLTARGFQGDTACACGYKGLKKHTRFSFQPKAERPDLWKLKTNLKGVPFTGCLHPSVSTVAVPGSRSEERLTALGL